jgi:putative ABC transport system permease protein
MSVLQDLRFALRQFLRSPGFFVLVVATLALGIGANLAIFSVARAVVLSPLPYTEPDRLVAIWETNLEEGKDRERVAPPNFVEYRDLEDVFADAAAWWRLDMNLTDYTGESLRVSTVECTSNFFKVLDVRPQLGYGFETSDKLYDENLAAVISDRLWRQRYSGEPDIVGKGITLNGNLYTVVGVMASDFRFPSGVDVWQRQSWDFSVRSRFAHFMEAVGRLRPGLTLTQAQDQLTAVSDRLAQEYPASNQDWRARVLPLHAEIVGEYGSALSLLGGAVGLLLLLASVNVANLLLGRLSFRQREMGIRAAIGAAPGRLLRQIFTESLVLGTCGAVLGFALAFAVVRLIVTMRAIEIPRLAEVSFDGSVLAFGLFVTLLTVLIFGVLPALRFVWTDFQSTLSDGARGGQVARRTQGMLVIVEVALAMTLLVGACLLSRSGLRLLEEEPGFVAEGVVTAGLELPVTIYDDWTRVSQFYSQLFDRLEARSVVTAVGATSFLPLDPAWIVGYSVPDRPPKVAGETLRAQYVTVSPGYFQTLGIPTLAGRTFDRRDTATSPSVVVINKKMAQRTWSDPAKAVGNFIRTGTRGFGPLGRAVKESQEYEVIGVLRDVKNDGLENGADPAVYFVHTQFPYRTMNLTLIGEGDIDHLIAVVRGEVRRLDADLPLAKVRTLDKLLAEATERSRFVMWLMSCFAALALLLAATGIYGVLSYSVIQRRYELAVRLSFGSSPGNLQRQVLGEGMLLASIGVVLGGLLAFALAHFMASLLFGVSVSDGETFAISTVTTLITALAACYLPARRASQMNPIEALRQSGA